MATTQYWTHTTSGETWAVRVSQPDEGEVLGVCGPLGWRDCPKDARDGAFDFDTEFATLDHFQTKWEEFRKGVIHEHADLMD